MASGSCEELDQQKEEVSPKSLGGLEDQEPKEESKDAAVHKDNKKDEASEPIKAELDVEGDVQMTLTDKIAAKEEGANTNKEEIKR